MENKLAENIRNYRKDLGFTQEQLAERLGVTLGAVSKWERGSSEPDLSYIMDLAELFHVSVDALIGFSMRGADADAEADRIEELMNRASFEELEEECENALRKFPNHFRIVFQAASLNRRIGTMQKDEAHIRRAQELYRRAVGLISQNKDPEISALLIRNEIAGCYSELKEYRRAVEEFRKNNAGGGNNAIIGMLMLQNGMDPEEGVTYTEKAYASLISEQITVMSGFIRYYAEAGKFDRARRAAEWAIANMERAKEDPDRRAYPDKIISVICLMLAAVLDAAGETEASEQALRRAVRTAKAFDEDPVYTMENMVFTDHFPKSVYFYDDAGPTAVDGLRAALGEECMTVSDAFREKFEREVG